MFHCVLLFNLKFKMENDVENNPTAKLMFYIYNVFKLIDYSVPEVECYKDYRNHSSMSKSDKICIIELCRVLNPEMLKFNRIIRFRTDEENEFLMLNEEREVLINGSYRRVLMTMVCSENWMQNYYFLPILRLNEELNPNVTKVIHSAVSINVNSSCVHEYQENHYCSFWGIFFLIFLFPIGLICFFKLRKKKCSYCKKIF